MASSIYRAQLRRGISAVAVAAALVISTPVLAQTTSTLRGRVAGAPAGTAVTITDLTTGQVINGRTNAAPGRVRCRPAASAPTTSTSTSTA